MKNIVKNRLFALLVLLSAGSLGTLPAWDLGNGDDQGDIGCDSNGDGSYNCTQKKVRKRVISNLPDDCCTRFGLYDTSPATQWLNHVGQAWQLCVPNKPS